VREYRGKRRWWHWFKKTGEVHSGFASLSQLPLAVLHQKSEVLGIFVDGKVRETGGWYNTGAGEVGEPTWFGRIAYRQTLVRMGYFGNKQISVRNGLGVKN
jgi:hypothetical protein